MSYTTFQDKRNEEISINEIWNSVRKFDSWLDRNGYDSYDPYDIWGTEAGLFARRIYYKNQFIGFPLISPFVMIDFLFPSVRRFLVKKQRYATSDAQLMLAYLNLYTISGEKQFLAKAKILAEDLLKISIPGYSGHCWGYPFDWQNSGALWRKNTPFITAIPYCFEAFLKLYDCTNNTYFFDIASSIAKFVYEDIKDTSVSERSSAGSYSPIDKSKVVNASAYRAMVLFEAAKRFDNQSYFDKAIRNLNFIIDNQQKDGSWLYNIGYSKGAFIDHFHTCFVIKNLLKISKIVNIPSVTNAIMAGYSYYRKNLFDSYDYPISFAVKPRTQIVKLEMYNFAEAITLGVLLKNMFDDALPLASKLSNILCKNFQLAPGHFVTRIFIGGRKHKFPFLRWPQSQLFYALTNLIVALESNPRINSNCSIQRCLK